MRRTRTRTTWTPCQILSEGGVLEGWNLVHRLLMVFWLSLGGEGPMSQEEQEQQEHPKQNIQWHKQRILKILLWHIGIVKKFFGPKIVSNPTFFLVPKLISDPKFISDPIFILDPTFFSDLKVFLDSNFFQTQYLFWPNMNFNESNLWRDETDLLTKL